MQVPSLMFVLALVLAPAADAWGSSHLQGRRLLQSASCPAGCMAGFCQQAGTQGGLRCTKCVNNLLVDKASGSCACPKGTYSGGDTTCKDCVKGSFCVGGIFSLTAPPVRVPCPGPGMTTLGMRSQSVRSCVNLPGFAYNLDNVGSPSATPCPADTYSPGMKKQRGCVPCPTGFSTNNRTGRTSPTACIVPPGWYLKGPGQAVPCPMGEFKEGIAADGNCIKCARGVSTEAEGSVSAKECKVVVKGYYATSFDTDGAVNGTAICPQGWYCPGGPSSKLEQTASQLSQVTDVAVTSTGILRCPDGSWTQMPGASSEQQCLTPPGHYTANGTTKICPDGHFRDSWVPPSEAPACVSCGTGVKAERNDRILQYVPDGTEMQIAVTSTSADCYIQPGQGLMYEALTKAWRALNCTDSKYGVSNTTYGLSPSPCRDCPTNMVAVNSATFNRSAQYYTLNEDGSGGFTDVRACVTRPGFGMSGRAAQRCDPGFYNPGNNYDACQACPFGYTTSGPGKGLTQADCFVGTGYGFSGGQLAPCPTGTFYSPDLQQNASTGCTACPLGRTTGSTGATSQSECQFCSPGWGGLHCTDKCGGSGTNATYGTAGREMYEGVPTPCMPCSADGRTATYSFHWNLGVDTFTPKTVSRVGAATPVECLSEYSQVVDGAYYLPLASDEGVTTITGVASFAECVAECDKRACQMVTYAYRTQECAVRVSQPPEYEGMPWLALKVLPAGYVGTSPWSVAAANATNKVKSVSSGMYVFYQEEKAEAVGIQVDPAVVLPNVNRLTFTSVKECLTACDDAGDRCSGITVLSTVNPVDIAKSCKFVTANTNNGVFKRTMIRADLNRLIFPTSFLCPSGYTVDGDGVNACEPLATPTVVVLFLRAEGGCTQQLVTSVQTALESFLSDPNQAFGVYVPGVIVKVGCYEVPEGQGARRRLLSGTYADLYATVNYPGTTTGGDLLVDACVLHPSNCTGDTPAKVVGGFVQPAPIEQLPTPSVTLVQQATPVGEAYSFLATYYLGEAPAAAAVVLTTTPASAMSCEATAAGLGAMQFTCIPLGAFDAVVVTANGPDPRDVNTRVQASMVVFNTTCLTGSISISASHGTTCTPCQLGEWAAPGATVCTPCLEGLTTLQRSSSSIDQCNVCLPGFGGESCSACPEATFSVGGNSSIPKPACKECGIGSTTDGPRAASCSVCAAGYGGVDGSCSVCPVGAFSGLAPRGTACTLCSAAVGPGFTTAENTSTSVDDCNRCLPGHGGAGCTLCPMDTYSLGGPANSSSDCIACDPCWTTNEAEGATACVWMAAGTNCSDMGKCYNGVCHPGAKTYEVRSVTNLNPLARVPLAQEWWWGRLYRLAGSPLPAVGQIVPLAGEVGRTSPANVTSAVVSGAPNDPRTGSPITTALLMQNPTQSDRVEAQVWYVNATADHPVGIFNGMKFKDFIAGNGTFSWSWYRGSWATATGGNAPSFRFTVLNPALLPAAAGGGGRSRLEFVWDPTYDFGSPNTPENGWTTTAINLNQGKLWVYMGGYATSTYGKQQIDCYEPLSYWMNSTATCTDKTVKKLHPWFTHGPSLYGTDDIFRDGIIWEVRVAALNPITLAYANNVKITTNTGYQYTYVFTN